MRRNAFSLLLVIFWAIFASAAPRQRIISVSPNLTEILYGLGAFDRVVAVSDYCTYPPEVKSLPRVGGWATPNLERIVSLHPDLVVMTEVQVPVFGYRLQQLGIPTLVTASQTVSDVFSAIDALGEAVGKQKEARLLDNRIRSMLERVREQTKVLSRPSVLLAVDHSPGSLRDLYVITQGSYLADLVELAGAHIIVPGSKAGYSRISKETLMVLNPQVILELRPGSKADELEKARSEWLELPELDAVRNDKIFVLREDFIPHNSQMIVQTVVLLVHILHPEIPDGPLEAK